MSRLLLLVSALVFVLVLVPVVVVVVAAAVLVSALVLVPVVPSTPYNTSYTVVVAIERALFAYDSVVVVLLTLAVHVVSIPYSRVLLVVVVGIPIVANTQSHSNYLLEIEPALVVPVLRGLGLQLELVLRRAVAVAYDGDDAPQLLRLGVIGVFATAANP